MSQEKILNVYSSPLKCTKRDETMATWLLRCTGTGGSRFIQICFIRNQSLSKLFSKTLLSSYLFYMLNCCLIFQFLKEFYLVLSLFRNRREAPLPSDARFPRVMLLIKTDQY